MPPEQSDRVDELPPELEARIRALEDESGQGSGFTAECWIWLVVLGVIVPSALLVWGWPQ